MLILCSMWRKPVFCKWSQLLDDHSVRQREVCLSAAHSVVRSWPLDGQSTCMGCDDGYFKVSSSSQSPCLAGSFCAGCVSTVCPVGTYQDSTQQSSCLDCPTTLFNPKTGQPSCSPCSAGSYRVSASQEQACEAGYRCPGQCSRVVCGLGEED